MRIENIIGRQILDSRGNPTVEADVWLEGGVFGRAAVPSGASTGIYEAHELRDGGDKYGGKGVSLAVANINEKILRLLKNLPADDQNLIDQKMIELDGTDNKSSLGANAILAVSLACAHAAAKKRGLLLYKHINDIAGAPTMTLPLPMMNVLNGGKHATNSADFQEFMIIVLAQESYSEVIRIGSEIFAKLKQVISDTGNTTAVGDEGGFTYPVSSNTQMLELLDRAVIEAGYVPGTDVGYALDVAASEIYDNGNYKLNSEDKVISSLEMIEYLQEISSNFPVLSIEDGLDQNEWNNWKMLSDKLSNIQLVGDDLLVTNPARLKKAIDLKAGNAILIKPNQIGTISETLQAIAIAKENNWNTIVSHRSGETEDVSIAHIAIGSGAEQIKTGSLSRSERTAKHNELMRLEEIDQSLKLANPLK